MRTIIIIALSLVAITGHGQKQGPYVVFKYTDSWYHAAKGIDALSFQLADVSLPIGAKVYIDAYLLQVSYKKKVYKMHRYFGPPAAFVGYIDKVNWDTIHYNYDTVKVIVEVYELPHKIAYGGLASWDTVCHCFKNLVSDSLWVMDSTLVFAHKVLAWEVWRKEYKRMPPCENCSFEAGTESYKWVPVECIKRLTYNRKEELPNVLQSWRVEW
jgi:hypothetical protein